MRIYTRSALLVLAVLLIAIPVFAGGGSSSSGSTTGGQVNLTVMQQRLDNQQVDFANLWYYKELERETGVRVNWQVVTEANWTTQVNLRFASLDLPDLFRTGTVDVEEYGVAQRLLVPISDNNLQANMPNYSARLQMNESAKPMYSSDGKLYYVGYLEAQNVNHIGNHYINQRWLTQLNLQIPTTVDQLTTVLTAFRDRAPNGNAATVLPMSAGGDGGFFTDRTQGLGPHFAMFGVPFQEDQGKVGAYAAISAQGKVQFVTE
jgi:putative aldouronate transport system substrate-binding protein